jgi:hypothetical protein
LTNHQIPPIPTGLAIRFFQFSLFWWLVAGAVGVGLRYSFWGNIPNFNYQYWLHTHSHLMFLGWGFNALAGAILFAFMAREAHPRYEKIFWLLQFSVLGILITFPIQGYAALSITFSSLHTLGAGYFAYRFWQDNQAKSLISRYLANWALIFMLFSQAGPLALGFLKANGGAGSVAYQLAVYFYLHFQYNAWFTLIILALFWAWLEELNLNIAPRLAYKCLILWILAAFLSYSLSVLWAKPPSWVYLLAQISAIMQVWAWFYLSQIIFKAYSKLNLKALGVKVLLSVSYIAFSLKIFLQLLAAFPAFFWFFEARNLIIAYLHLVFLGLFSSFLLAYFTQKQFFCLCHWLGKIGAQAWLLGLILTEIVLVLPPTRLPSDTAVIILFGLAVLMFVASVLIFLQAIFDFD